MLKKRKLRISLHPDRVMEYEFQKNKSMEIFAFVLIKDFKLKQVYVIIIASTFNSKYHLSVSKIRLSYFYKSVV